MRCLKIIILVVSFFVLGGLISYLEDIPVPREELEEYLARMESDRETIKKQQEQILDLQLQVQEYSLQINSLQRSSDEQEGIYIGGNIAYPWGGDAIVMYKFHKWGLYIIGGYNNGFDIGAGAIFKMR